MVEFRKEGMNNVCEKREWDWKSGWEKMKE